MKEREIAENHKHLTAQLIKVLVATVGLEIQFDQLTMTRTRTHPKEGSQHKLGLPKTELPFKCPRGKQQPVYDKTVTNWRKNNTNRMKQMRNLYKKGLVKYL